MLTLLGRCDDLAIDRIRHFAEFAGAAGYWFAFSGGKDSVVLLDLAKRARVRFEAHWSMIPPLDPPPLVRWVRRAYPEVHLDWPAKPFFEVMKRQGYPTRVVRWCCREFKERAGAGRFVLTGIRWAESVRRSKRSMMEVPRRHEGHFLHPIIDWRDEDVWAYIRQRGLAYSPLYDEGFHRLGCVGCPQVDDMMGLTRWPHIYRAWERAFRWLYDNAAAHPMPSVRDLPQKWSSADALFRAWLDRDRSLVGDLAESECVLFT